MTDISIDTLGTEEIKHAISLAPDVTKAEAYQAAVEATMLLEREVRERTPVGAGGGSGLRGSISAHDPIVLADSVLGEVGTPLQYAVPVELGSKAHMPPVTPIIDWVEAKLGLSGKEAKGVAFAIARKISKEGTEGAFMFRDAYAEHKDQVEKIFREAGERIVSSIEGQA